MRRHRPAINGEAQGRGSGGPHQARCDPAVLTSSKTASHYRPPSTGCLTGISFRWKNHRLLVAHNRVPSELRNACSDRTIRFAFAVRSKAVAAPIVLAHHREAFAEAVH